MLADDMACNARNPRPGKPHPNQPLLPCHPNVTIVTIATVFNNANQHINVYGDDIEVDYRGYEVGKGSPLLWVHLAVICRLLWRIS